MKLPEAAPVQPVEWDGEPRPRSDAEVAIELRNVVKAFGERVAVDHLSLTVARGEVFGMVGPNGSGKTTTVNLLSGLSRATSGDIRVLGHNVATHAQRIRASLGAVPQETALYEELTAAHNLRLHADLYFVPRRIQKQRIDEILSLVQLADRRDSRVRTFSGGMKRRLALGRALLHDPDLIILDEPTLGVDVQSRQALWDHIVELRASGKTILLTTNYLEEAERLCDRIAILDRGRLIALDTPPGLRARFGDTTLHIVTVDEPIPALLHLLQDFSGVTGISAAGRNVTVTVAGEKRSAGDVITAIAQISGIESIEQKEPSLDTVFLGLTGRGLRD